jgi:hypothetical protein
MRRCRTPAASCSGAGPTRRTLLFWPTQPTDDPFASILNALPKYVASRTLKGPLSWQNSHLLEGDVADAVGRLKAEDGKDLQVIWEAAISPRP